MSWIEAIRCSAHGGGRRRRRRRNRRNHNFGRPSGKLIAYIFHLVLRPDNRFRRRVGGITVSAVGHIESMEKEKSVVIQSYVVLCRIGSRRKGYEGRSGRRCHATCTLDRSLELTNCISPSFFQYTLTRERGSETSSSRQQAVP
ncbi:uncharacterized protein K441DRAFT_62367 [Cenococcum geophilum 1.58]|uniref:uncharacterized protein n=1 Tax=Cenococcum geophilum 1.58 TaxID=794803 RepID=UPI00358F4C60|nr:hypothetical protein K441DRAFT_62367 [Cenococcum geophilum 1.58]